MRSLLSSLRWWLAVAHTTARGVRGSGTAPRADGSLGRSRPQPGGVGRWRGLAGSRLNCGVGDIGTRSSLTRGATPHDGTTRETNVILRAREILRQRGEFTVERFQ